MDETQSSGQYWYYVGLAAFGALLLIYFVFLKPFKREIPPLPTVSEPPALQKMRDEVISNLSKPALANIAPVTVTKSVFKSLALPAKKLSATDQKNILNEVIKNLSSTPK